MNRKKIEFTNALLNEMQTKSLSDVKIYDICQTMNCSRQSFYYYFDSIESCFSFLIFDAFEKNITSEYLISDIFNFFDREYKFIDLVLKEEESSDIFWDTLYSYIKKVFDATIINNFVEYRGLYNEQKEAICSFYTSGLLRIARDYLNNSRLPVKEKCIQYCKALIGTAEDIKRTILRFN